MKRKTLFIRLLLLLIMAILIVGAIIGGGVYPPVHAPVYKIKGG